MIDGLLARGADDIAAALELRIEQDCPAAE
jgi:hypothetical protein